MTRRLLIPLAAIILSALIAVGASAGPGKLPDRLNLPDGWQPEGIASGEGKRLFVGSIPTGAVYRLNARTGNGAVAVPATEGRSAIGLKADRRERLFVAGGETGMAFLYNGKSGADLAQLELAPEGEATFVNDVVLARNRAYFTDSQRSVLYVVNRKTLRFSELELRGFEPAPGFNLNGIEAARKGRILLTVQTNTGDLWRVNSRTGDADRVRLGGEALEGGDGLLRSGRKLFVALNSSNEVAVVRLAKKLKRGKVVRRITNDDFDAPTTIARKGRSLYVANARFGTTPEPDTPYWVTRVGR